MAESKDRSKRENQGLQTRGEPGEQGLRNRTGFPDLFSSSFGSSPFQMMRRMSEEMDRMFERAFGGHSMQMRDSMWSPRIEAFQKEDKFVVRADLPGLKKDDVEVNVTEDAITINGQRKHEQEDRREGFYVSERSYGSFHRTIPLPQGVIADSAKATFRDGVLEITLQAPPEEVTRGRRIEVTDGAESDSQK